MKSRIVSRREFLTDTALAALAISLYGCTKSVTKYRADGTPYTEKEDDWVGTLAAVVLFFVVLAALAASNSDSSSLNDEGEWQDPQGDEGKIRLASMDSKRTLPIGGAAEKVSVTNCSGKLLVTVDAFEHVEHKDLEAAEFLLASAQISDLQKPILIRLKQDKPNLYRIEYVRSLKKPSGGKCRVVNRKIDGKLYNVKVFTYLGNIVDIEIVRQVFGSQSVA
ncbi:MAG: hypothetical protein FVQ84_04525 [Planctomycetes bacterium]|nr:hypothetical protein [Planctomycetota bacterium]